MLSLASFFSFSLATLKKKYRYFPNEKLREVYNVYTIIIHLQQPMIQQ